MDVGRDSERAATTRDMTEAEGSRHHLADSAPLLADWVPVAAGINGVFRMRDGGPELGTVKVWGTGVGMELEIFVAPGFRRCGLGRQLLAATSAACRARRPSAPLVAKVKRDNTASRRLFAAAGYTLAREYAENLVFLKEAPQS